MQDNNRKGETRFFFNGRSKTYYCRPEFHDEVFEALKNRYGMTKKSIVVELGAGTGKFTKKVAPYVKVAYAVEPNDEMYRVGKLECEKIDNIKYVHEMAEDTNLDDNSIDFALAVQSFHYFDKKKLLIELNRIVKDDGYFAIIWNMSGRSDDGFDAGWTQLMEKMMLKARGVKDNHNVVDDRKILYKDGKYEELTFKRVDRMSFKKVLGFANSLSFIPSVGEEGYEDFYKEFKSLFDRNKKWGKVNLTTVTTLQIGKINRI